MHKQAALNTGKNILFALVGAFMAVAAFELLTPFMVIVSLGVGLVTYLIYIMYSIEKSRLECLERINSNSEI